MAGRVTPSSASVNREIIISLLTMVVVAGATVSCASFLYRFARERTKPSVPVTAIILIGVTALITGLQFVFPEVLSAFRRNREALLAGEWWRMVTPLFVQAAGKPHAFVNGVAVGFFLIWRESCGGKGGECGGARYL